MHTQKILCPTDFSDGANSAVEFALDLARPLGAEIWIMHAYELPVYLMPMGVAVDATQPGEVFDFLEQTRGELANTLEAMKKRFARPGIAIHARMVEGAPADTIKDMAQEIAADLVVMASHGRTGLSRLMLGSVAERVMRTAPCPVLTVPIAA